MRAPGWLLVAFLLVLALGLAFAGLSRASRQHAGGDCASKVVIGKGPDGEPRECVCMDRALAACFKPGP